MSLGPVRAEIRALVEQLDPARMPPAESERILEEVRRERPELAAAAEAWLVRIGQLYDNLADLPANEQERRLGDEQKSNPDVASLVARLLQVTEFQVPIWLGSLPAEALAPRIPHYEVLEELGRGGMGVVYTARHRALGRIDALKVLLPEQLDDPDRRDRFNKEAKALALLKHPNVVQIYNYDAGEQADCPYLLMEFVDGGNLSKQLGGNPLQVRRAVQLVETLARAMHVVHECGVIHRDLKPVNVLLAADGTPKIADFGLARQVGGPGNETPSCYIMGTPSYVAPEQAQGKNDLIGERTDVYALGAILYECLTGQPPFHGETTQDTLRQVCEEVPKAPSQWNPSVPRPLEAICLRCLEKEPDKRYKTANELADALDGFRQEAERSRQVVSSRFLRIVGAVVLGISALLSLLLITLAPDRLLWVGFVATGSSVGVWLSLCTFHEAFRCTFLNGSPFFRPRGKESETTWVAPRSDGTSLHGWGAVHWALTFMILPIALIVSQCLGVEPIGSSFLEFGAQLLIYAVFVLWVIVGAIFFYDYPVAGRNGFRQGWDAKKNPSFRKELLLALTWSSALSFPPLVFDALVKTFFGGSLLANLGWGLISAGVVVVLVCVIVGLFLVLFQLEASYEQLRGWVAGGSLRLLLFLALSDLIRTTEGPVWAWLR